MGADTVEAEGATGVGRDAVGFALAGDDLLDGTLADNVGYRCEYAAGKRLARAISG